MDGTKRKVLVSKSVIHPTALTIDFAMENTIYWADHSLNTIEMIKPDGSGRTIVLRGDSVDRPSSLDVFESTLYWISTGKGELRRQDKFGRGVVVRLVKDIAAPSSVKVFSEYRYNKTVTNPCLNNPCSHLCVLIPGGFRCACPVSSVDGQSEMSCDATQERPRPSPLRCPCQNRGVCTDSGAGTVQCRCPADYEGAHCETYLKRRPTPSESVTPAYIIVPVLLIIVAALAGAAVYVFFFRRSAVAKSSGFTGFGGSPSVSFRHGTNVEFGPTTFSGTATNGSSTMEPIDSEFNGRDASSKSRDFSNPMYDAVGGAGETPVSGSKGGIYEVPADTIKGMALGMDAVPLPASAIISPSSVVHHSSPQIHIRHRELDPTTVDTGKDTQNLVEDASDC